MLATPATVEFLPGLLTQERRTVPGAALAYCTLPSLLQPLVSRGEETGNGKVSPSLVPAGSVFSMVLCEFSLKVNG